MNDNVTLNIYYLIKAFLDEKLEQVLQTRTCSATSAQISKVQQNVIVMTKSGETLEALLRPGRTNKKFNYSRHYLSDSKPSHSARLQMFLV